MEINESVVVPEGTGTAVNPTVNEPMANQTVQSEGFANQNDEDVLTGDDFPQETDKQREAFVSMKKFIKEQKQRIADLESRSIPQPQEEDEIDLIDAIRTPVYNQPTSYGVEFDETDPATRALLDRQRLIEQQANLATQQVASLQAQQEDMEAWAKYPQLNPKSQNRDKAFRDDVQQAFIMAKLQAQAKQTRPPRLVDVADKVMKRYDDIKSTVKTQVAQEEREVIAQKEAASLESRGTSVQIAKDTSALEADLRKKMSKGDASAAAELLRLRASHY